MAFLFTEHALRTGVVGRLSMFGGIYFIACLAPKICE